MHKKPILYVGRGRFGMPSFVARASGQSTARQPHTITALYEKHYNDFEDLIPSHHSPFKSRVRTWPWIFHHVGTLCGHWDHGVIMTSWQTRMLYSSSSQANRANILRLFPLLHVTTF